MNKGFEVIEACWLFDFSPSQVEVVVHPQSSVHAMIEYSDGSVLAQICATDMRMPIQYALTYPDRFEAPVPKLNWAEARTWEFLPPDFDKFPLLKLAYQCQETGGSATVFCRYMKLWRRRCRRCRFVLRGRLAISWRLTGSRVPSLASW
jgi:1-deoxy-D-xylulose-5-phosphate reductoisomerase